MSKTGDWMVDEMNKERDRRGALLCEILQTTDLLRALTDFPPAVAERFRKYLDLEIDGTLTTEQRCKTCQHWGDAIHGTCNAELKSQCHHPAMRLTTAGTNQDVEGVELYIELEKRSVIDGPYLITGPDFGCVHWERKE
jgi:hypothetical protein